MSGSDAGVAELFHRYRDDLFRYVVRFTGDPDLADDVVQDTFVRLTERPPPDRAGLRGWLFTVATNLSRDAGRTAHRRFRLLSGARHRLPHGEQPPSPAVAAERADLRRRVRAALDELSDRERTILLMREEGFTHREIAEAVGSTTKSIGTMIARALTKMARSLEPERGEC